MCRTYALLAAVASIAATVLLEAPCMAQDSQSYAVGGSDPIGAKTSQSSALSPGPSMYWSKMHQTTNDSADTAQRAAAITERIIQSNQRRYCGVVYLAALIYAPGVSPVGTNNSFVSSCQ